MNVHVKYAGPSALYLQKDTDEVTLAENATVDDLIGHLCNKYWRLKWLLLDRSGKFVKTHSVFVNGISIYINIEYKGRAYVDLATRLMDGDVVTLVQKL